jgi:hypothetical protein
MRTTSGCRSGCSRSACQTRSASARAWLLAMLLSRHATCYLRHAADAVVSAIHSQTLLFAPRSHRPHLNEGSVIIARTVVLISQNAWPMYLAR